MKTPLNRLNSIRDRLSKAAGCSDRFLWGGRGEVCLSDLLQGTSLGGWLRKLAGRSILLAARDQLAAAAVLIELDGVARRIVICPPDVGSEQIPSVIAKAGVNAIVSDCEPGDLDCSGDLLRVRCSPGILPAEREPMKHWATEWVLLTSGTASSPKMIVHTMASLVAPIETSAKSMKGNGVVWGTFYDIRRYGGLQVFLRAVLGSGSLVLSSEGESVADHLARLSAHAVTHLSGTPSHWRRALMSPRAGAAAPQYVRLSGEIADQAILNALQSFYPNSAVVHAFASTEAGVAFEVTDGLAGFPSSLMGRRGEVEMKVRNDSLLIRSNRAASRHLDPENGNLADDRGFVDTGDIVERIGDRYYFRGRSNGAINVGGLKVYPEEVEAVINRHPAVRMSIVRSRRSHLVGGLVSAEVCLKELSPESDTAETLKREILEICLKNLPPHKIPVTIQWVPTLDVAASGKLARRHA